MAWLLGAIGVGAGLGNGVYRRPMTRHTRRLLEWDRIVPDGLHDTDALAWSERRADLLRRHSKDEVLNEAVDWPNVIEEIEAVGRSELHACESLLRQAMVHLPKLHAWPDSSSTTHWHGQTLVFLDDAQRRLTPSIHQRIRVPGLYARALRQASVATDAPAQPRRLPSAWPFRIEDLLASEIDFYGLAASLAWCVWASYTRSPASSAARNPAACARSADTFAGSILARLRSGMAMRGFLAKRSACRAMKSQYSALNGQAPSPTERFTSYSQLWQ